MASAATVVNHRLAQASKALADAVFATISEMEALATKALKSRVVITAGETMAMMATVSEALDSMTKQLVATERRATMTTALTTILSLVASTKTSMEASVEASVEATVEATVEASVEIYFPAVLPPVPTSDRLLKRTSNTRRMTSTS